MDNAVALVQAYLRVNGYFTVTEYPVVEAMKSGEFRNDRSAGGGAHGAHPSR